MELRNKTVVTIHGPEDDQEEILFMDWPYDIDVGRLGMAVRSNDELTASWKESFQIESQEISLRASWNRTGDCHEVVHQLAKIYSNCLFQIDFFDKDGCHERIDVLRGEEVCYSTEEEGMPWEELILLKNHEWFSAKEDKHPSLVGCPLCSKIAETSQWNKRSRRRHRPPLLDEIFGPEHKNNAEVTFNHVSSQIKEPEEPI